MASTFPRCSAAVFGVLSLACSTAQAAARPAQDPGESAAQPEPVLDLEKVFELSKALTLGSDSFSGWLPEGQAYLATQNGALVRVDAESGQSEPHFDPARAEQAFAALPGIGAELAAELAGAARESLAPTKDAALVNACGDLFHYRLHDGRAVRLTHDPLEEVGESLSPDGELAAYISNWNLHLVPTGGGTPRPLTTEGDENHLYGRLDWVYQEELYGRGNFQGFWWSPDSQRIACLILDETEVPQYTIPDHRKTRPEVEVWRYPKAGDPNPRAALAVLDVAGGAPSAVRPLALRRPRRS